MKNLLIATFVVLALCFAALGGQDDVQRKKIDFLISSVENLKGAKFIRNGTEYEGKEAAAHLRMKLRRAGGRVRSAEDFIKLCASKSFISGTPYLIKFPTGKYVKAEDFFTRALKEYCSTDSPQTPKTPGD